MFKHSRTRILNVPVILMAVLALCLVAFTPAMAKKGGKSKRLTSTQKKEISIVKKIMDKHQKALELAMIGDQKTTDTAVKTFCAAYATRMQNEIDLLGKWLGQFDIAYAPRVNTHAYEDLLELEGVEFTRELLGALIGAHNANIAQEKQLDKRGYQNRSWAKKIVAIDKAEVKQIKIWLKKYDPDGDVDQGERD